MTLETPGGEISNYHCSIIAVSLDQWYHCSVIDTMILNGTLNGTIEYHHSMMVSLTWTRVYIPDAHACLGDRRELQL